GRRRTERRRRRRGRLAERSGNGCHETRAAPPSIEHQCEDKVKARRRSGPARSGLGGQRHLPALQSGAGRNSAFVTNPSFTSSTQVEPFGDFAGARTTPASRSASSRSAVTSPCVQRTAWPLSCAATSNAWE